MNDNRIVINEEILRQLFDMYVDPLTEFLSYYTRNQQKIEDVIQEVFIKLWEERDTLNIFYIKSYLYKATRNQILNALRNKQNRAILLERWSNELIENTEAEDCVNMEEFEILYKKAVELLPPKCKDIYLLSREERFSYKEIAKLKEISEKTVENQMSIALKKIKEYLQENYGQGSATLIVMGMYAINQLFK